MQKKINNFYIVTETYINVPKSLKTLKAGEEVKISCTEFSSLQTVRTAITRLNQDAGFIEFQVWSPDNGATLIINRNIDPKELRK